MKNIRIENIRNMHMNSKPVTIFDVYVKQDENTYVFSEQRTLMGHIKKESTIIKKIGNE